MDDIQSFFSQKICCFLGTISSQDHQTVQTKFIISLLHSLYLVKASLVRYPHKFKRLAGSSQNSAASGKDSGKVLCGQHSIVSIDQTFVSVIKAVHFQFIQIGAESLNNTTHGCVQSLAVSAACKQTDSFHFFHIPSFNIVSAQRIKGFFIRSAMLIILYFYRWLNLNFLYFLMLTTALKTAIL